MKKPDYDLFMSALRDYLINLDEVEKELENRIDIVRNENSGTALIVLGPRSSGKRSIIKRVVEKHAHDMSVIEEDGEFGDGRDSKEWTQKTEESFNQKERKTVVVIHNFDRIAVTVANKVLYWFAQQQKLKSYLLVLVSENADARQSMEKRILSRIGQNTVKVEVKERSIEEDWKLVRDMITHSAASCTLQFRRLITALLDKPSAEFCDCWTRSRCDSTPYARFKLFAAELAEHTCRLMREKKQSNRTARSNDENRPNFDGRTGKSKQNRPLDLIGRMLYGISNRMYGFLIAAALQTKEGIDARIPVQSIRNAYKYFLNSSQLKHPFLQYEGSQFQADVEFLVSRGFWTSKSQNEQILFVYWQVDPVVVLDVEHRASFNTILKQWIENKMQDITHLL